jgi:hypothetical protein
MFQSIVSEYIQNSGMVGNFPQWEKKRLPLHCALVLTYHNLFAKTFPFTIPITRSSFYDFFNTSRQHLLHLDYDTHNILSIFTFHFSDIFQ